MNGPQYQIGEFANDYIEIRRDYTDGMAPFDSSEKSKTVVQHVAAGDRHGIPDHDLHRPHTNLSHVSERHEEPGVQVDLQNVDEKASGSSD